MFLEVEHESSLSPPLAHITQMTGAKVRVFLTEVAEGTSNYRSLHSLTQQVEHQYHGRFLIELIQNAHDAFEAPTKEIINRIEVVFDPADSPYGSLLVANDGLPFSQSNFDRLSQLGQSDKDPQKSIGNKGIGFRSVLEISNSPEVYSRHSPKSTTFDGFCFAFRPDVVKSLDLPVNLLATSANVPEWSVTGQPLVESWSKEMLTKFRAKVRSKDEGWLSGETKFLSPYLLPIPLTNRASSRVAQFESDGFSSVIRLPLKSDALRSYVLERMNELGITTVLFLEKLSILKIGNGSSESTFARHAESLDRDLNGERVVIQSSNAEDAEYGVWKHDLHVSSASEKFRKAIEGLPGRWPEIQDISVSVAVRFGATPEAGRYSIYLPTRVHTGSAAHINAPFFGDMSRTSIDFEDSYNEQLRDTALDLAVKVVRERLAGKSEVEACAIVDILAPFGTGLAGEKWIELIDEAAARTSASMTSEPLTLAERGWRSWDLTSLVPTLRGATCLTEDCLRRHATFDVFHRCLDSRLDQVRAWAAARFSTGANPTDEWLAATAASVARELHEQSGDWNVFWREVGALMPNGQAELAKHEVLLGTDGMLHRASGGMKIFFLPRQGTQDDSDVGNEADAIDVPQSLRSSVAFVSDQIQMYDMNRPAVQTAVRAYLGNGNYVSRFRVETIFSEILLLTMPSLPAPLEGGHYERCREILSWALRLVATIVSRGKGGDATLRLLGGIPVPCDGGWFPMRDASFGVGWSNTVGDVLQTYLNGLESFEAAEARKRVLLPPEHAAWPGVNSTELVLLKHGGVFDGLRLLEIKPTTWQSEFNASEAFFQLPTCPPGAFPPETWTEWAAVAQRETRPPYRHNQPYQVGSFFVFPGMAESGAMPDFTRTALSELIFHSLPSWGPGLEKIAISKRRGEWNKLVVSSPLRYFLRTSKWMAIREQKGIVWANPAQRWFVPADMLSGRARHFAHLRALPIGIARMIAQHLTLLDNLRSLGMPNLDPHSNTSNPALLDALTAAVDSDDVADSNVLLGQIRDAWQRFRPDDARQPLKRLPVRRRNKLLAAIIPTPQEPAFIPDTTAFIAELEEFDFPVVAIGVSDAKELRDWFAETYQDKVQFTSTLSLVPKVNGLPWTGAQASLFAESELSWLLRPLLVLAAHGRGVHSTAFKERSETLRMTRVAWVPSLHVAVSRDDTELAITAVTALWDTQRKTLILTEGCKSRLEAISGALSHALERDDLELPLRFLLRSIPSIDDAPDDVATFLAPLNMVTPEQVHEVLEHLKGDLGHMARLVSILIAVLSPGSDVEPLSSASTEEELSAALVQLDIPLLNVARVLQASRDSQDLFDFGRTVSKDFGSRASMAYWNKFLADQGLAVQSNRQWALQLQASLEEAASSMKRVIAHAIGRGAMLTYAQMRQEYVELVTTANLSQSHWSVEFPDAMALVANVVKVWLDDQDVIRAIRDAESNDQLTERLVAAGVAMDSDPDECSRNNSALFETVALELDKLYVAFWVRSMSERPEQEVQSFVDRYRAAASTFLASEAFVTRWTEGRVMALLKNVKYPDLPGFGDAVVASSDLASLRLALNISTEEVANVKARMEAMKATWMRKRRMVDICGNSFDSSEDNLHNLWSFLSERNPDTNLDHIKLDLSKPSSIGPGKTKRNNRNEVTPPTTRKQGRPSKGVEELVGLAGEIYVFRLLRKMYGENAVTASAWVSENSLKVFPSNLTDDGRGCDFAFTIKGKQYRIEVKASTGNDESFTMGSSEIRLAMDIGTKSRRRKEIFRIVHVTNALSTSPSTVVLPNPYDPAFVDSFRIEDADARVRYWKT